MRGIWAGALLTCYLALGVPLLLVGYGRVGPTAIVAHTGLLAVVAAATFVPNAPRWIRSWTPLAALLFLYSEIPWLIAAAGHASLRDGMVIAWEGAIFGGQPARAWAQRAPSRWLSEVLHVGYLSYYGIIFAVPVALQARRRGDDLARAVLVLMVTFVACFAWYIAFPVAGPRYLWPAEAGPMDGPVRRFTMWLLDARSSRGTAFPSSHVAVAVTQSILAVAFFGRRGWILAALTALLAAGAVYGGFHYAIDVVAGGVVGAVIGWAGAGWIRRDQAKASAPT